MPRNQIPLAEVLSASADAMRNSMAHCMPGIVQAYYSDTQEADVQPAVNDIRFPPSESEERTSEPWPVLPRVPIAWPRFGGFTIAGPISAGDHVLLIAFDQDPSVYRANGQQSDPVFTRRHGGNFWIAYPCNVTDPGRMHDTSAAAGSLVIGKDGANQQIRIDGSHINLGATVTDPVALSTKIDLLIKTMMNWIPVANDGGAALKTALTTAGFTNTTTVASPLVKSG